MSLVDLVNKDIKITEEFLQKNSFTLTQPYFETYSEETVWQFKDDNKQLIIELEYQEDDNLIEYYFVNACRGELSVHITVSFVYELQLILKLLKYKKDIVL